MHKELKNEFIRHSTLIFHPLCTIPIENFHPNRNFFLLKCIFQHPASGLTPSSFSKTTLTFSRCDLIASKPRYTALMPFEHLLVDRRCAGPKFQVPLPVV